MIMSRLIRFPGYILLFAPLFFFSSPAIFAHTVDHESSEPAAFRESAFRPCASRLSIARPSSPSAEMESEILRLVNLHRHSMGLTPVQMNTLESTVARLHSQNMASGKTPFGHGGFNDRAAYLNKKMGPITLVAENVASGQMSAREVVDGWLHSPGHRRNIEGNFKLTGIGLARGSNGMIYYTQIFTR